MQVSFVIPVYNQISHTRDCLAALTAQVSSAIAHEIIIVNDGSTVETRDYLDALPASIRVEHLPANQGFAGATNRGAEIAQGQWLCLLNNDVAVTAGAIAEMIRIAAVHPDAGIVGNVQISTATETVDHAGIRFVDGGYPVHHQPTLAELAAAPDVVVADAVTAACCLVDRSWFINTGGLDTGYQNGFEDVDLCLRAREAGWEIYVAHRSTVRHAISASEGRSRFEYRNAKRFLQRWGPRTAALERFVEKQSAHAFRASRIAAPRSPSEPPAVQRSRQRSRAAIAQSPLGNQQPTTVWVDLLRLEPAGANGGIKPLVYGLLHEMEQLPGTPLRIIVLAQSGLRDELSFLSGSSVVAWRPLAAWHIQSVDPTSQPLTQTEFESRYAPEVLYCPFGTSEFMRPGLPVISLLVDALHRDLPAALPIEEVNFREQNFQRIINSATWIQTLAQHGIDRLNHYYGIHPTRCFYTYAAVHGRLGNSPAQTARPATLPRRPFFFYPANFWPHKNHEVLLTAYQLYRHRVGDEAWDLLLTGHPNARMQTLVKLSESLGLAEHVSFAGHLDHADFIAVWQHAGALVFPSLHEGFGIPLVEAFHASLPVAASATSVLPEVGGDACAWFDPRDPNAVAQTLAKVAGDPGLRHDLAAKGKVRLSRFSLSFEARRLKHFLYAAAHHLVP